MAEENTPEANTPEGSSEASNRVPDGPEADNYGYQFDAEAAEPKQPRAAQTDNYGYDPSRASAAEREQQRRGYAGYEGYGPTPAYDGPQGYYYGPPRRERRPIPGYVKAIGGCLVLFTLLLLFCGIAAGVVAGLSLTATPATSSFSKTLNVSGTPTVMVHGASGRISVVPGAAGIVQVQATKFVRALSHDQAQQELDAITITTTQTGNTVDIEVNTPSFSGFAFGIHSHEVNMTVTVPTASNLNVTQAAGTFDANGITGQLIADVSAGTVSLDDMTMTDGSRLTVSAGTVDLHGRLQTGASMRVDVSAGSVTMGLPRDTNTHLDASASAGDVTVNGWDVSTTRNAANTTVKGDLGANPTGTLTIQVSAGSATVNAE